ncbi:nuclear transport factor 2 family protein [Streptomyces anulatus]
MTHRAPGVPVPAPSSVGHTEVVRAFRSFLRAMADGDTEALGALSDDGFTLTHITGYRQPKAEWLSEMRAGQFVYHGIAEEDVAVEMGGDDRARLVGLTVTDATVYGTRAPWRLRLTMDYARPGGTWTALRAVATTW